MSSPLSSSSSTSASSHHYVESDFPILRQSGRILAGTLTTCTNTNTSSGAAQAVVLLLHGLASHKDHNFAPALAHTLSMNAGLNVLRFNFRSAPPSPLEPLHRFRICGADDDVDDVSAVLAALALRNMYVITLIGHSRGAAVALLSATRLLPSLSKIQNLVLLAPRWEAVAMLDGPFFQREDIAALESGEKNHFVWMTRAGEVTVTRDDIKTLVDAGTMEAPLAALASNVKVLIIHGDADRIIPLSSAYAFHTSRPEIVRVVVISGASHNFETKSHADELINAAVNFLAPK